MYCLIGWQHSLCQARAARIGRIEARQLIHVLHLRRCAALGDDGDRRPTGRTKHRTRVSIRGLVCPDTCCTQFDQLGTACDIETCGNTGWSISVIVTVRLGWAAASTRGTEPAGPNIGRLTSNFGRHFPSSCVCGKRGVGGAGGIGGVGGAFVDEPQPFPKKTNNNKTTLKTIALRCAAASLDMLSPLSSRLLSELECDAES